MALCGLVLGLATVVPPTGLKVCQYNVGWFLNELFTYSAHRVLKTLPTTKKLSLGLLI
jgi:hypothetical protein